MSATQESTSAPAIEPSKQFTDATQLTGQEIEKGLASGVVISIIAKHSSKTLDVPLALTTDGVPLWQWDTHGGTNQRFRLDDVGGGYFRITSVHSGKTLTVAGGSPHPGGALTQSSWEAKDHQQFRFEEVESSYFRIVAKKGGNVFDVVGGSRDKGGAVILSNWHGGEHQRFRLVLMGPVAAT